MITALIASFTLALTGVGPLAGSTPGLTASAETGGMQDRTPRGTGNQQPPSGQDERHPRGTDRAKNAERGWITLFDGSNLDHWRGFKQKTMPAGWEIQGGTLCRVDAAGDIVTRQLFENFDLRLEWKVAPGGNSGIFWRASEDRNYVWETAPEMQILDNEAHRDGLDPTTSAGADYALYAPDVDAAKPAGEWNDVRILVQGTKVTYWLNGQRIVHYELWSDEWEQRVKASKFASMPGYGRNTKGHIALQDHGDEICFRNIRIRQLPAEAGPSGDRN